MKALAIPAAAALTLAACATGPSQFVEEGYERGALGVAAIARQDWTAAEAGLTRNRASADPARLINLGTVYMETGRTGAALSAWRLALASSNHRMVATMDGKMVSTRDLAERALARHEAKNRTAGR